MSDVQTTPGIGEHRAPGSWAGARAWSDRITPARVIVAIAVLALGLRMYYLSRPGYLLSVTEYDDGSYLGSAIRLVQGQLPYRDFVFVQPPGITLLMVPIALLSKITGTAAGLVAGRLITLIIGTADVVLAGLLVRHRGILAVLLTCGIAAVHPDGIAASHTILVEPWLVAFCLAGALAVFDGDRLASGRRVMWGGVAFGFAGVIEAWAIVPVLVLLVLNTRTPRRAAQFAGAVAAGFLIPTLPFAVLAPGSFYQSIVVAQVGKRVNASRIYGLYRIRQMIGLSDILHPAPLLVVGTVTLVAVIVLGAAVASFGLRRRLPPPLEWFAAATGAMMTLLFLWPPQFHYHFVAFLVPFLALSVALSASRLMAVVRPLAEYQAITEPLRWGVSAIAAGAVVAAAVIQVSYERHLHAGISTAEIAAVEHVVPAGACVLADEVSYLVVANRFVTSAPDCPVIDDGTGVNYALSHGLNTATGAGRVPAVAALWRSAFAHSQFIWLSPHQTRRIPWSPFLMRYFRTHFSRVPGLGPDVALYKRHPVSAAQVSRRQV